MGFIEKPPYNPPFIAWFEVPSDWDVPETWNVKDNTKTLKPIQDINKAVTVVKKLCSCSEEPMTVYIEEENGRVLWENAGEYRGDCRNAQRLGIRIMKY